MLARSAGGFCGVLPLGFRGESVWREQGQDIGDTDNHKWPWVGSSEEALCDIHVVAGNVPCCI